MIIYLFKVKIWKLLLPPLSIFSHPQSHYLWKSHSKFAFVKWNLLELYGVHLLIGLIRMSTIIHRHVLKVKFSILVNGYYFRVLSKLYICIYWVCWLCFLYICVDLFGEQKYIILILSFRTNFLTVNLGPILIWLNCLKIHMARDYEAQCAYTILYEKLISFSLLSLDMSLTSVKHNQYNIEPVTLSWKRACSLWLFGIGVFHMFYHSNLSCLENFVTLINLKISKHLCFFILQFHILEVHQSLVLGIYGSWKFLSKTILIMLFSWLQFVVF